MPQALRKQLKKPLGELVSNLDELKLRLKPNDVVICVGDRSSETILKNKIKPKICIYDGKCSRKKIKIPEVVRKFKAKEVQVQNPPGQIRWEVFRALDNAISRKTNTKIIVDGEEDLITLAAIKTAPNGSKIIYGQPKKGLVVVDVTDNSKAGVDKILDKMTNVKKGGKNGV